ncbi:aldo/keto reductase [Thelephora terrestris]|uniref:Aldo/keto reductase n=1 Tax=Thelephora terrestris TaxID=56493 RepID=A0A9P6HLQ1_9AGAM|nr:aldo/keto reductase [Thelephora terrestris]
MSLTTVRIGDSVVCKVGLGLMRLTWTPNPVPYDQAFDAIKAAIDAMPAGVKLFLNSGEFYGNNLTEANLDLLASFFEKYPGYADKTFLSVKGASKPGVLYPDSSEGNLRRSVDNINKHLRGTKKLDLFECARVDPEVPIEECTRTLQKLIEEGRFSYIGMSEPDSVTLRRAHAVHPIAAVEIQLSPWAYKGEMKKIVSASEELGITVVGYSLFRGLATQQTGSRGRSALHFDRFSGEHNMNEGLRKIAERKGVSTGQLCIAWVASLGDHVMPLPGSSKRSQVLENLAAGSFNLTTKESDEIIQLVEGTNVHEDR